MIPSPPVDGQTKEAEPEKSTSEKEPTEVQDEGSDPEPEEKTSEESETSPDSRNEDLKHEYKAAFVKSL